MQHSPSPFTLIQQGRAHAQYIASCISASPDMHCMYACKHTHGKEKQLPMIDKSLVRKYYDPHIAARLACICMCVCVCVRVCVRVRVSVCACVRMRACVRACARARVRVCICECCVHACVCKYMLMRVSYFYLLHFLYVASEFRVLRYAQIGQIQNAIFSILLHGTLFMLNLKNK